MSRLCCFCHQA